jgi:hypothetical protein
MHKCVSNKLKYVRQGDRNQEQRQPGSAALTLQEPDHP